MKMKSMKSRGPRGVSLLLLVCLLFSLLAGCSGETDESTAKLDPKDPVTISVWHYYNGAIMEAFDAMVDDFNATVGAEKGIVVESSGMGSIAELEKAVLASANKEVGSPDLPNIFASYADTAYEVELMGILADLDEYLSQEEQAEYHEAYLEEGHIGQNGELRIFPIAKSTEVLMINATDWEPFAAANNLSYDDLATVEGVARVSALYYHWTDEQTPDVQGDGKAFFGRDSMANFFTIGAKELDAEIFQVSGGEVTLNVQEDVMRRIWDCHYVPYISGYMTAYGRYRSDDAKVGDLLAYVGSTTSTMYFPSEITTDEETYPVTAKALPAPHFEGGSPVMIQQGAGMVVTKATAQEEYASVEFLKWFTDLKNNILFSALSGYMPVKKEAMDYDTMVSVLEENGEPLGEVTDETLRVALDEIKRSELYNNKAFSGAYSARNVLEYNLQDKAVADREQVLALIADGLSHEEAVAQFDTDEHFERWLEDFTSSLNQAIS